MRKLTFFLAAVSLVLIAEKALCLETTFASGLKPDNSLRYEEMRVEGPIERSIGTGRFLSVDPSMDLKKILPKPQMWNRYGYVVNNPILYTDPDGREHVKEPGLTKSLADADWSDAPAEVQGAFYAQGALLGGAAAQMAKNGLVAFAVSNPKTLLWLMSVGAGTTGAPGLPGMARHLATAERVGNALKADPMHRAASLGLNAVAAGGQAFSLKGGDGQTRLLIQAAGSVNGKNGVFEYIVNKAGQVVHQRFIVNGVVNGVANQKPPV